MAILDLNKEIDLFVIHEEDLLQSNCKNILNRTMDFIHKEGEALLSPQFKDDTPIVEINSFGINSPTNLNYWSLNLSALNSNKFSKQVNNRQSNLHVHKFEENSSNKKKNISLPSEIKSKGFRNNSSKKDDSKIIMRELKELKEKYSNLENEIKNLKKNRDKKIKTKGVKQEKKISRKKKITEEDKIQLVNNINKLNITEKKEMRVIVKDYITIYSDGQFQFNINCLPKETFYELKKYVEVCLNSRDRNIFKMKLSTTKENSVLFANIFNFI
jgi:hypothetical protein